jgi:hypothetical protein
MPNDPRHFELANIAKLPELPGKWRLGLDSWAGRS